MQWTGMTLRVNWDHVFIFTCKYVSNESYTHTFLHALKQRRYCGSRCGAMILRIEPGVMPMRRSLSWKTKPSVTSPGEFAVIDNSLIGGALKIRSFTWRGFQLRV